jgi:hypothetical protein
MNWIKRSLVLIVPVMAIAVTIIVIDSLAYWLIPKVWVGFAQTTGMKYPLSSNSKCNTAGPDGLRCCHANEIL